MGLVFDEIVELENELLWERMDNFSKRCPGCGRLTRKGGWCKTCQKESLQEKHRDLLDRYYGS